MQPTDNCSVSPSVSGAQVVPYPAVFVIGNVMLMGLDIVWIAA